MAETNTEKFEELVKGQRFVMFTTLAESGELLSRPMTIQERDGWLLRFVTQADNDVAVQSDGRQVNLSLIDGGDYVSLSGTGRVERDLAKKQELWNAINDAFAGDAEDPNNVILEVEVDQAEYWEGGNPVSRLVGLAKTVATGEADDAGEHGVIAR